jgi:hypothetical protein
MTIRSAISPGAKASKIGSHATGAPSASSRRSCFQPVRTMNSAPAARMRRSPGGRAGVVAVADCHVAGAPSGAAEALGAQAVGQLEVGEAAGRRVVGRVQPPV